jgi:hypothetical protein
MAPPGKRSDQKQYQDNDQDRAEHSWPHGVAVAQVNGLQGRAFQDEITAHGPEAEAAPTCGLAFA